MLPINADTWAGQGKDIFLNQPPERAIRLQFATASVAARLSRSLPCGVCRAGQRGFPYRLADKGAISTFKLPRASSSPGVLFLGVAMSAPGRGPSSTCFG